MARNGVDGDSGVMPQKHDRSRKCSCRGKEVLEGLSTPLSVVCSRYHRGGTCVEGSNLSTETYDRCGHGSVEDANGALPKQMPVVVPAQAEQVLELHRRSGGCQLVPSPAGRPAEGYRTNRTRPAAACSGETAKSFPRAHDELAPRYQCFRVVPGWVLIAMEAHKWRLLLSRSGADAPSSCPLRTRTQARSLRSPRVASQADDRWHGCAL